MVVVMPRGKKSGALSYGGSSLHTFEDLKETIKTMATQGSRSEAKQVEHLLKLAVEVVSEMGTDKIDVVKEHAAMYRVAIRSKPENKKDNP